MTSSHTFGNTCTPTGERQGPDTIWTKCNIGISPSKMSLRLENILSITIMIHATEDGTVWKYLQSGNFDSDF